MYATYIWTDIISMYRELEVKFLLIEEQLIAKRKKMQKHFD